MHRIHTFTESRKGAGFANYVMRTELLSRKSELLPGDVLTILCTIKHPKSMGEKGKTFFS